MTCANARVPDGRVHRSGRNTSSRRAIVARARHAGGRGWKGDSMARTLKRTAAFTALAKALVSGARGGPSVGKRLAALPRMVAATTRGEYDGGLRVALMAAASAYVI